MVTVAVAPFVLKNATFLVAADNYEAHVSQVEFNPSTSQVQWHGLSPSASFTDSSSPSWAATLSYAQDWVTPNSLSKYLFDHQGQTVVCKFTTNPGAGVWTASLIIAAGSIGGTVSNYAVATVTLGISAAPTYVPPALADPAADDSADDVADRTDDADVSVT
jgi:hypothetical protein